MQTLLSPFSPPSYGQTSLLTHQQATPDPGGLYPSHATWPPPQRVSPEWGCHDRGEVKKIFCISRTIGLHLFIPAKINTAGGCDESELRTQWMVCGMNGIYIHTRVLGPAITVNIVVFRKEDTITGNR